MYTLHELARLGATQRVKELRNEIAEISRKFSLDGHDSTEPVRKRRMSVSARKRISEAQKKRWALAKEQEAKTAARDGRLRKGV